MIEEPRQRTPEWIAARFDSLGSSEAAVACGESPYRTPFSLWEEKVNRTPWSPDPETARLLRIGTAIEPVLLEQYSIETGRGVQAQPVMLRHPEHRWMTASLDAVADGRIVEAKWTNARAWREESVPGFVQIQVQHQLAVADREVADVVALVGAELRIVEIRRDRELFGEIFELEERFWRSVVDRVPPEIDGSEATRRAILSLFPEEDGSIIRDDPAIRIIVRDLLEMKGKASEIASIIGSTENSLRFLLEAASGFECEEAKVSYKRNRDSVRVAWEEYAGSLEGALRKIENADPTLYAGVMSEGFGTTVLDDVRGIYSRTVPGPRVLRVNDRRNQG